MQPNYTPIPRDHALIKFDPKFRMVKEPGTYLRPQYAYVGYASVMQQTDLQGQPVQGIRQRVSFQPDHQYPRDRSKYSPHQGEQECARRVRQLRTSL